MNRLTAADPDALALDSIEALLRNRQTATAESAAREFMQLRPARIEGAILLGRAMQQRGDFLAALTLLESLCFNGVQHPAASLLKIECLLQSGDHARARPALDALAAQAADHPRLLQDVGAVYSHLNLHESAERCYGRAVGLAPRDPQARYNWATCLIALGRMPQAEAELTQVIALAPQDYDAYYNRSTLRRQTPRSNHVAELQALLTRPELPAGGVVAVGYALAKELEDLQRHSESFVALKRGADARRGQLSYRVAEDLAAMNEIACRFDAHYWQSHGQTCADSRPLFIVGLPRSGTTLVDRILSSHSQVHSRGESSDLAATVMQLAGPVRDKLQLIERATAIDPAALGGAYCARLPVAGVARIIDKTPINFLYLAMIGRALPNAHIIHVRRQPLDVCYAMYKTLFRIAYPFSYDLGDLGRYYLGYHALMRHWRTLLGERLIEVDYEDLVSDQEGVTRRLLQQCGLRWEEGCLNFDRNQSPTLTASAAQVRQPIYRSSVNLWRRYEGELQPLIQFLAAAGVLM